MHLVTPLPETKVPFRKVVDVRDVPETTHQPLQVVGGHVEFGRPYMLPGRRVEVLSCGHDGHEITGAPAVRRRCLDCAAESFAVEATEGLVAHLQAVEEWIETDEAAEVNRIAAERRSQFKLIQGGRAAVPSHVDADWCA